MRVYPVLKPTLLCVAWISFLFIIAKMLHNCEIYKYGEDVTIKYMTIYNALMWILRTCTIDSIQKKENQCYNYGFVYLLYFFTCVNVVILQLRPSWVSSVCHMVIRCTRDVIPHWLGYFYQLRWRLFHISL
jgi:hypothetical protein